MKNKTALHLAAKAGDTDEIAKLIEDLSKEPRESGQVPFVDEKDCTGWTPLHWAASRGKDDVVAMLIEKNCNVNAVTGDNWSAAHDAARNGSEQVLRLLKGADADMHIKTQNGNAPMHLAAQYGREAAVNFLCGIEGANMDEQNNLGHTALHVAARRGHEAIVSSLIDKRANVLLLDRIGRNAEALAKTNTQQSLRQQMLNRCQTEAQENKHASIISILEKAFLEQRAMVLNNAELALNSADEAMHMGDKAKARAKLEDAVEAFTLAGDEERVKLTKEKVAAVVKAMKEK